jgi:hypothetical protein
VLNKLAVKKVTLVVAKPKTPPEAQPKQTATDKKE